MMYTGFLLSLLLVGAIASSQDTEKEISLRQQRFIGDIISEALEDVSQSLIDAGLDPLRIENEEYGWALPVPTLLSANATVENLLCVGISNIILEHVEFSILQGRINAIITIPAIHATLGNADGEVSGFGYVGRAQVGGRLTVAGIRVNAEVFINILGGLALRSLDISFSVARIQPELRIILLGTDYSYSTNILLGITIPGLLQEFGEDINDLLEIVLFDVVADLISGILG